MGKIESAMLESFVAIATTKYPHYLVVATANDVLE